MQRFNYEFTHEIEPIVSLKGQSVLDIGCGDGKRSAEIAGRCLTLVGIDLDAAKVTAATARGISNATFIVGSAEALPFDDDTFDIVFFTLSLHHVPIARMEAALNEAVRVVRPTGHIVVLELGETGTFFDAELEFDIADGDNQKEKAAACRAVLESKRLTVVQELTDDTHFQYDSVEDFVQEAEPKKNQSEAKAFLEKVGCRLTAKRRIFIAQPLR